VQKLRKASITFVISVCLSAWNKSLSTGRVFMKFGIWVFFGKYVDKIQVSLKSGGNNAYFT
jgi:hypothetical protein